MHQKSSPSIVVSTLEFLEKENFSELFSAFDERGLLYTFEKRKATVYASLDWLIPTGVVILITHSYFDGVIKEIGKENYQWFKKSASSLYRKLLGKNPETTCNLMTFGGKVRAPSHFSGSL